MRLAFLLVVLAAVAVTNHVKIPLVIATAVSSLAANRPEVVSIIIVVIVILVLAAMADLAILTAIIKDILVEQMTFSTTLRKVISRAAVISLTLTLTLLVAIAATISITNLTVVAVRALAIAQLLTFRLKVVTVVRCIRAFVTEHVIGPALGVADTVFIVNAAIIVGIVLVSSTFPVSLARSLTLSVRIRATFPAAVALHVFEQVAWAPAFANKITCRVEVLFVSATE